MSAEDCDRRAELADVLAEIPELRADPALRRRIEDVLIKAGYLSEAGDFDDFVTSAPSKRPVKRYRLVRIEDPK